MGSKRLKSKRQAKRLERKRVRLTLDACLDGRKPRNPMDYRYDRW